MGAGSDSNAIKWQGMLPGLCASPMDAGAEGKVDESIRFFDCPLLQRPRRVHRRLPLPGRTHSRPAGVCPGEAARRPGTAAVPAELPGWQAAAPALAPPTPPHLHELRIEVHGRAALLQAPTRPLPGRQPASRAGLLSLLECGPACSCSAACPARTTQRGVQRRLQLQHIPGKAGGGGGVFFGGGGHGRPCRMPQLLQHVPWQGGGHGHATCGMPQLLQPPRGRRAPGARPGAGWRPLRGLQGIGVCTLEELREGDFVAEYAGELLSSVEADRRLAAYDCQVTGSATSSDGDGHALLVSGGLLVAGCWGLWGIPLARPLWGQQRAAGATPHQAPALAFSGAAHHAALWAHLAARQHRRHPQGQCCQVHQPQVGGAGF